VGIDPTALGQLLEQGAISQQRSSKSPSPGRHDPGMVGGIIPESVGGLLRNQQACLSA
jgi:hypothetical protein